MTPQRILIALLSSGQFISAVGYDMYNYPEPFNCEAEKWHFNAPFVDMSNLKTIVTFENGQKPYFNTMPVP